MIQLYQVRGIPLIYPELIPEIPFRKPRQTPGGLSFQSFSFEKTLFEERMCTLMARTRINNVHALTFDELQRSMKRMQQFLSETESFMDTPTKDKYNAMINNIRCAIQCIPKEYHIKKHKFIKEGKA